MSESLLPQQRGPEGVCRNTAYAAVRACWEQSALREGGAGIPERSVVPVRSSLQRCVVKFTRD